MISEWSVVLDLFFFLLLPFFFLLLSCRMMKEGRTTHLQNVTVTAPANTQTNRYPLRGGDVEVGRRMGLSAVHMMLRGMGGLGGGGRIRLVGRGVGVGMVDLVSDTGVGMMGVKVILLVVAVGWVAE